MYIDLNYKDVAIQGQVKIITTKIHLDINAKNLKSWNFVFYNEHNDP